MKILRRTKSFMSELQHLQRNITALLDNLLLLGLFIRVTTSFPSQVSFNFVDLFKVDSSHLEVLPVHVQRGSI
jgi:hypothetical protein